MYLSLGTKRVASWHWLHEVVLERQGEVVTQKTITLQLSYYWFPLLIRSHDNLDI